MKVWSKNVTTRDQKKEIERENRENKATHADKPCIKSLNHHVAPKQMKNIKHATKGASMIW